MEPCYEEQDGDLEFINLSDSLSSHTDSSSQTIIRRPVRGHDRSFDPVHGLGTSFDPVRGLDQSFDSSTSSIQPHNHNNAYNNNNNNNNNNITRSKDETVNFKSDATTMRNKVSQHLHQQQTMSTSDATTNQQHHYQHQKQLEAKKSANDQVGATSGASTLGIKQTGSSTPGMKQPLSPPPSDPMFYEWMDMYEKLHRLNRILETKVIQIINFLNLFHVKVFIKVYLLS